MRTLVQDSTKSSQIVFPPTVWWNQTLTLQLRSQLVFQTLRILGLKTTVTRSSLWTTNLVLSIAKRRLWGETDFRLTNEERKYLILLKATRPDLVNIRFAVLSDSTWTKGRSPNSHRLVLQTEIILHRHRRVIDQAPKSRVVMQRVLLTSELQV